MYGLVYPPRTGASIHLELGVGVLETPGTVDSRRCFSPGFGAREGGGSVLQGWGREDGFAKGGARYRVASAERVVMGWGGADSALKPNPERSNAADPVQGNWVGLLGGSDPDWVAWRGMDTVVSNFLLLISPGKVGAVELRRCYWGWGGEARAAHMGQELWAVWLATCTPVPSLSLDFQPTHSTPKSSGSQGAPRGCRALEKQSPDFPQAPG